MRSLNLLEEDHDWTILQFMPFKLENIAIGGRLMVDTQDSFYYLEILDKGLTQEKKETLVRDLTPLLAERLDCTSRRSGCTSFSPSPPFLFILVTAT